MWNRVGVDWTRRGWGRGRRCDGRGGTRDGETRGLSRPLRAGGVQVHCRDGGQSWRPKEMRGEGERENAAVAGRGQSGTLLVMQQLQLWALGDRRRRVLPLLIAIYSPDRFPRHRDRRSGPPPPPRLAPRRHPALRARSVLFLVAPICCGCKVLCWPRARHDPRRSAHWTRSVRDGPKLVSIAHVGGGTAVPGRRCTCDRTS